MVHDLKAITEIGHADALRGLIRDDCTYRSATRRAAWLNGWHKGNQYMQNLTDKASITDVDREKHKSNVERLRSIVGEKK